MNYTVYILFSPAHDKIYIGFTNNLVQRFRSHNQLGKDWTMDFRPWIVIYVEVFEKKQEAMVWEKKLKQANNRAKIRRAIETQFNNTGFIDINHAG